MSETRVPPDRGVRRRRLGLVLVAALLLALLIHTGLDLWAGHRVEVETSRIEQRHGSLALSTLNVPPVPAADNRARVARAAAALTTMSSQELAGLYSRLATSSPMPDGVRAFAEANRDAVRLAAGIGARRQSNWEVDYVQDSGRPALVELRTLSDAIYASARLDLEAGRADEAAAKISSGLAASASLRQEPDMIAQLIRIAMAGRQLDAVQRLLAEAEPSKTALDEVGRWLVENREPDPMRVGLAGEMKQVHALFGRIDAGQIDPRVAADPPSWIRKIGRLPPRLVRPVVRWAHATFLRSFEAALETNAGPRPRRSLFEPSAPSRWAPVDRMVSYFLVGLDRAVESGDDFVSDLSGATLAVALRRFRLDRGAYPDDLAPLVPGYLAGIPTDPFTGRPPEYARRGAGFTLRVGRSQSTPPQRPPTQEWTVSR